MPKFNPISRWSERNQLLVLSLVVGIVVGLAAVLLKTLISVLQEGLRDAFGGVLGGSLYYLALPGIGMLLAMLFCKYVIKDSIGHGVTKALQAVSRHESRIKPTICGLPSPRVPSPSDSADPSERRPRSSIPEPPSDPTSPAIWDCPTGV